MLLIFTHKVTPRLTYSLKQVLTHILGIEFELTTKVEDFIKHEGPKMTYTKKPLQNEFFVRSNDLLFENGINDIEIKIQDWEGVPCFFATGERSNLPFDIFSASFYLLSRYEEYLPHVKDSYGRFPATESLAYQNDFLKTPVVDVWAYKVFAALKERFPELKAPKRKYYHQSILDVTTSHCYAHRGVVRGFAGLMLDLFSFKLRRVWERMRVSVFLKKDPYDNFDQLIAWHKKYGTKSIFFFQFAEYSTYDKNVAPTNRKFRNLIKSVADYGKVALSASYSAFSDLELLKTEKKNLENVLHRRVKSTRMRYNRVNVPDTYRHLVEAEFTEDYTMGYTHQMGFRAGTCSPFYFYDITMEQQRPIRLHPFAIHDYALLGLKKKDQMILCFDELYLAVKKVGGPLITLFSNELLGEKNKVDRLELYHEIIRKYYA